VAVAVAVVIAEVVTIAEEVALAVAIANKSFFIPSNFNKQSIFYLLTIYANE